MKHNIAIVGATGLVGQMVIKILEERGMSDNNFFFYSSGKSNTVILNGKEREVLPLTKKILKIKKLEFALFCTGEEVSKEYVKKLAKKGVIVIDFSSYYRKEYPLIIPEINLDQAKGNILCNPNCSTTAAVMALHSIHKMFGLKRIVYSTYQAVSGAGKAGLEDLQIDNVNNLKKFDSVIKNNIIPYIGEIDKDGYSHEENKMVFETKKILNDDKINITATCVRVPIENCHSISINFQTRAQATIAEIEEVLKKTEGVKVLNKPNCFPMPIDASGGDDVLVGRIRKDLSAINSFNMFVVSDNLRKGAAQNGVQILEGLIKKK